MENHYEPDLNSHETAMAGITGFVKSLVSVVFISYNENSDFKC